MIVDILGRHNMSFGEIDEVMYFLAERFLRKVVQLACHVTLV